MSSQTQIVLIDLPSQAPCKTWSLNPWKTRFLLNYKNLDYRTEWVEYPDLKPRLENHVSPSTTANFGAYTSPTVILPNTDNADTSTETYMMDSRTIATTLESRYPTPTLHLDSPVLPRLEKLMTQLMPALTPIYLPLVPVRLLNPASHPYWYRTREAKVGMSLDALAESKGGNQAWDAAKPHLDAVTELLKGDMSGPYFLGQEVSYADFVWGGFLVFVQRIGVDVWEKLLETVGEEADVHAKLLFALGKWSERDDR